MPKKESIRGLLKQAAELNRKFLDNHLQREKEKQEKR